jgi:hypothetical protein
MSKVIDFAAYKAKRPKPAAAMQTTVHIPPDLFCHSVQSPTFVISERQTPTSWQADEDYSDSACYQDIVDSIAENTCLGILSILEEFTKDHGHRSGAEFSALFQAHIMKMILQNWHAQGLVD